MCGRFLIEEDDELFIPLPGKKGEVQPGDNACVYLREGRIQPAVRTWGFISPFADKKLIINARSETCDTKSMFRDILSSGRLLVPASCYFEYDSNKQKYRLGITGGRIYMAGLYRGDRFVILTRQACTDVSFIHDRMPVILSHDDAMHWLDSNTNPVSIIQRAASAEVLS